MEELCPKCGASYKVWKEVFNEEHHCPDKEDK